MPKRTILKDVGNSIMREALRAECRHPRGFFKTWFISRGQSYFVLFKKNLRVTNIQYAEVLSLIVKYRRTNDGRTIRLQFLTVQEFNQTIADATSAFLKNELGRVTRNERHIDQAIDQLVALYADLLKQIVVIDELFGSCGVFLPPGMEVDWESVCAASGYIHSCGLTVFFRNLKKAREKHLFDSVIRHVKRYNPRKNKLFFAVYAHEDFTAHDRDQAPELRHGLDDVKIHVHKFHMGKKPLLQVLSSLKKRRALRNILVLPQPGNYNERHSREERSKVGVALNKTLWLLIDSSIGSSIRSPGDDRYYVCYEQEFINENPFHILDENKPAWVAHTTIPHTLMGAMLNLAWMYAGDAATLDVLDPFVGSGTTWLEGTKFDGVTVEGSDVSPMADRLTRDNLEFFALPAQGLESVAHNFIQLVEHLQRSSIPKKELKFRYDQVIARVSEFKSARTKDEVESILRWLGQSVLSDRVLFYTGLKAEIRHLGEIQEGRSDFDDAFRNELVQLIVQIHRLSRLRRRQEDKAASNKLDSRFMSFPGMYSTACSTSVERFQQLATDKIGNDLAVVHSDKNAIEVLRGLKARKRYDLIVTDPPYGFNTDEDSQKLATLYDAMVGGILESLKDSGQLIIALPEFSRTGRDFAFFTQKDLFLHQIMFRARQAGIDVVATGQVGSRPPIARAPYYWESERALRRTILHLRFRRAAGQQDEAEEK